jgi:thiamine transport system permease protein
VWVNLAVVVRTVGALLAQLDPALEDAAATLGASPWRRFRHVVLPLAWPAVLAAASIVFLFCFTSFGIARVLAGPAHPTLEVEIWRRATQAFDLRIACALAVLQLLVVGAAMAWAARLQRRAARPVQLRTAAGLRPPRTARQRLLVGAVAIASTVVVVIPVAMVVLRSFRVRSRWSLSAWSAVLHGPTRGTGAAAPVLADPLATVTTSLRIALAATVIAVVVGGLAAVAIDANQRAGRWLDTGLMLPLGTSAVVVGFGLLITFDQAPLDLRGSSIMLPLGQALVAIPFVVRAMLPTLRAIDPDLRHAAATLGAAPLRAWREVDLPILRRAIGAAAGFAFAISLGEFGATSFLTRAGNETIPIGISRLLGRPSTFNLAQAFVLTTLLIALTTAVVLVFDLLREGRGVPGGR